MRNKDDELTLILVALMSVEAKYNYDMGYSDGDIPKYTGEFLGDLPKGPQVINGVSGDNNNYPLGANPKRGGFRR